MQTLRLVIDPERIQEPESQRVLDEAAAILRRGGTVALPTETVYGLGANALNASAVAAIFEAKQRPDWDPLIVHVCDEAMLARLVDGISEAARKLMQAFWPGPLTLLLPRSSAVPDAVTAGRPLVGVRMPAHPVALELIRRAGVPIAAPSANRFGHTSPTTAAHVLDDLDGRIDAIIDAGPTALGLESTVLYPGASPMIVYRPGAITLEQIRQVAGPVEHFVEQPVLAAAPRASLPSPGVGVRHYAPNARLILVETCDVEADLGKQLRMLALENREEHLGILLPAGIVDGDVEPFGAAVEVFEWGRWAHPEELAQRLFAGLRHLDALGCTVILCPIPPEQGIGAAIRDRLRKAASKNAIED
jgi:L-threonylcarbamoyladenylate synthase